MFYSGDKVYDSSVEKSAVIVNLRNDSHEKLMRSKDHTHYYYHLNYDDGTFDTYVSGKYLTKIQSNPQFEPGQRFVNTITNKIGTIRYLRNDERERNLRLSDPSHYYYHVDYDDGSFETYEYQLNLKKI